MKKKVVFNGGKDDMSGVDFNFKTMKMNTSYNVAQSANEMLLNNSDLQMHQQSSGNNNNNYEYRQHGNVMGTQNGRGERKAYLASTGTTISGSNVNKNSSSKYSYNKPMTPGEYRTEYRSEHMSRYQRNFK